MATPQYPEVRVQLVGFDRNSMSIVGRVRSALRQSGVSNAEIHRFSLEALAGDYSHALRTVEAWVTVTDRLSTEQRRRRRIRERLSADIIAILADGAAGVQKPGAGHE